MDPKLTEQLQQMLTGLLASAQDASVWAKGQVPLLVQEKIVFGRVWSTGMLLICCVVAVMSFRAAKRFYAIARESKDRGYDVWPERPGGLLNILTSVLCLIASGCALGFAYDASLCWFAPRLYIVEWLMSQIHQ